VQAMFADVKPGDKFSQIVNADADFERMKIIGMVKERSDDKINNTDDIDRDQRESENVGALAGTVIELIDLSIEFPARGRGHRYFACIHGWEE
jgi:hypothetical protein